MATAPLLTATPSGDLLELRPSGSWTAADVATLETLSDTVTAQLDRSETIRVDMTEVRELDTLGQIRSSASLQDNRLILAQSTRSPHSSEGLAEVAAKAALSNGNGEELSSLGSELINFCV